MTPYYQDSHVTIYHGDNREVLPTIPDKSVDLILTDPPYGLNYNDGDLASVWEVAFGGDLGTMKPNPIPNDGEEIAYILFGSLLREAARILKKDGGCCCCSGGGGPKPLFARWVLMMDEILQFKQAVVWDKPGLGMGHHYRRCYEFILVAHRKGGRTKWNGGKTTGNVLRNSKIIPLSHQHPTEKPIDLMFVFVRLHTDPDDLVIDPFLGHGATLIASKQMNRRAIGIEIEEKYCEIAAKRCELVSPNGIQKKDVKQEILQI